MACQNSMKKWSYLGSPFSWRRMFRRIRIIRQKTDAAFCKSDVEKLKKLTLHSVYLTHTSPPPGFPLSDIRMRVSKGPSLEIKTLAPSLVPFLEAAAANSCQDNGPKHDAFEVLQKALVTLTNKPITRLGVNFEVAKSLDGLLNVYNKDNKGKTTINQETVNVAIVDHILQHLTRGCFVLNKSHLKVLRHPKQTFLPYFFSWDGLALGHRDAWYGELDMLVCPLPTDHPEPKVAVLFENFNTDSDEEAYGEEDDTEEGFSDLAVPEATFPKNWSLFGSHFSQGFATAVTFSYVYHYTLSESQSVHSSLLPTIQLSPRGYQIYLYDCIQDVMLANNFFWSRESMIYLWAFLHHHLFLPANLDQNMANCVPKFGYDQSSGFYANRSDLLFGLSLNSQHWQYVEPEEGRMV